MVGVTELTSLELPMQRKLRLSMVPDFSNEEQECETV